MKRIYLDHAATTPVEPRVVEAMLPYFHEVFGNPSSLHSIGQEARRAVENAREVIASFLAAKPEEIIFTSGGTESDNTAIKGVVSAMEEKGNHIITSAIEHHAVLETCKYLEKQGVHITYLKVDKTGLVDPDDVRRAITDKTVLISIMHANNEIGTIEPIADIGAIAHERGVLFHTDAVQSFGHLPINVNEMNVDLLSASAHKLYGPKGVGILYVREGTRMFSFMHGGGQERGRRASTHNVPGIAGLGKVVELAGEIMEKETIRLTSLRDKMIKGILDGIGDTVLNGHPVKRLPNNINVSIGYIEGETLLLNLDRMGIACATGSACTSSAVEPSHVLAATGLSHDFIHGSLRLTLGRSTSQEDIDYVLEVLPGIVDKVRSVSTIKRSV
ncbi:MAG: cysteine desulfurase NifS [Syntrophales bacterium]